MVNIDLENLKKWQPLFDYEGTLIDTVIEYKITKHDDGMFSVDIRDLMKEDKLLVSVFHMFKSPEEVEEYLVNCYNKLVDLTDYESQLKFNW